MEALNRIPVAGDLPIDDEAESRLTAFSIPLRIDQRPSVMRHLAAEFNYSRNLQMSRMLDFFDGPTWRKTMKRNEWTVPYTGKQLADAAAEKKAYHESRHHLWWSTKREEVIAKIKADGMTITDSIVDELSKTGYANTSAFGNAGPTVQIDAGLQNHLAEAHGKMKQHEKLVKEYDAWGQMMGAHEAAAFNLQLDDWMYFFGK
jgi:hypothetical protein